MEEEVVAGSSTALPGDVAVVILPRVASSRVGSAGLSRVASSIGASALSMARMAGMVGRGAVA